jgi:hypothetical protein
MNYDPLCFGGILYARISNRIRCCTPATAAISPRLLLEYVSRRFVAIAPFHWSLADRMPIAMLLSDAPMPNCDKLAMGET